MARPSHPPRLDYSNSTWRRVQITKLLIMKFSPFSRHLIPLLLLLLLLLDTTKRSVGGSGYPPVNVHRIENKTSTPAKGTNYSVCYNVDTDCRLHLDSFPLPFSRELQNTWNFPSTPPHTRILGAVNSSRAANCTFTFHKGTVSAGLVHSAVGSEQIRVLSGRQT
jgi:hypothetical protein